MLEIRSIFPGACVRGQCDCKVVVLGVMELVWILIAVAVYMNTVVPPHPWRTGCPQTPKSADAQVSCIKWCSICVQPTQSLGYFKSSLDYL